MRQTLYAVYQIVNPKTFELSLRQDGFESEEDAANHMNDIAGGRFIIIEYLQ